MTEQWKDQSVLITGVCGTVGRELLRQLAETEAAEIVGLDNNESELFFLKQEYRQDRRVRLYLGDIRDASQIARHSRNIDIILHSAALKHVILCEESPREPVQTNIVGTQNVIDAALANNVSRVIFTSSDKAVNPTNVMGTSKLMGERLMTAANSLVRDEGPIFASTRFGNVLGSRGSVIPLFRRQILSGGPVTVTDDRMSRFIMTLSEAVSLVMKSVFLAKGGEVFVTKMPAIQIKDLATAMTEELSGDKPVVIDIIGAKPGEKLYEELINDEETRRTVELDEYYAVLPAFKAVYKDIDYIYSSRQSPAGLKRNYSSETTSHMKLSRLRNYLRENGLL